jgi:hypothetical protein
MKRILLLSFALLFFNDYLLAQPGGFWHFSVGPNWGVAKRTQASHPGMLSVRSGAGGMANIGLGARTNAGLFAQFGVGYVLEELEFSYKNSEDRGSQGSLTFARPEVDAWLGWSFFVGYPEFQLAVGLGKTFMNGSGSTTMLDTLTGVQWTSANTGGTGTLIKAKFEGVIAQRYRGRWILGGMYAHGLRILHESSVSEPNISQNQAGIFSTKGSFASIYVRYEGLLSARKSCTGPSCAPH